MSAPAEPRRCRTYADVGGPLRTEWNTRGRPDGEVRGRRRSGTPKPAYSQMEALSSVNGPRTSPSGEPRPSLALFPVPACMSHGPLALSTSVGGKVDSSRVRRYIGPGAARNPLAGPSRRTLPPELALVLVALCVGPGEHDVIRVRGLQPVCSSYAGVCKPLQVEWNSLAEVGKGGKRFSIATSTMCGHGQQLYACKSSRAAQILNLLRHVSNSTDPSRCRRLRIGPHRSSQIPSP